MDGLGIKNYCFTCLLVFIGLLFSISAFSTTYYISNSGNDANSGLTVSLPWKTLAKVNATTFKAGDQILFNRGETFYGTITVSQSGSAGNVITYGAYGTGANPVITGFSTINSWTNLGSNIWESTSAVSSLSNCNMVTINGIQAPMGRYPNSGWLTYQTFSTNVSITSTDINSAITNWTGAEVVIKKAHWVIDRNPIISHSGGTLTYSGGSIYNGMANYGFFIQNDFRTLDVQNEWYFDPLTKRIRIYSNSQPTNIKISTVNNLLVANNSQYFTIDGISYTGANSDAISLSGSSAGQYATIQNCSIDFSGRNAITGRNSNNLTIQNTSINHTNNSAILLDINSTFALIRNNTIQNTGLMVGHAGNADGSCIGIKIDAGNSTIEHNLIEYSGFNGICFDGSHILVKNNFINYTNLFKDDGGGIYSFVGNDGLIFNDRKIIGNIVLNCLGCGEGTADGRPSARGIYFDGYSNNIDVIGNTISGCSNYGIYVDGAKNIILRNNTSYNNSDQLYFNNWKPKSSGIDLKNNIFISKNSKQRTLTFQGENLDIANFGVSDSNYYATIFSDLAPFHVVNAGNPYALGKHYNLKDWQLDFNKDLNSKASPLLRYEYDYTITGVNKFTNEKFLSNILGITSANCTTYWIADGGLDGGCIEISNPMLSTKAIVQFKVGALELGKTYLVKLSSKSSKRNSLMRVNFIQNTSPYSSISYKPTYLDTERIEHQLLFTSTFSHSNVSMMIALSEGDPKVWIDNVQIYEVNSTMVNPDEYVQFFYNNTLTEKSVSLISPRMINARGESFDNGSVILEPYSSMVLMKAPIIVPDAPDSVKAIAGDTQATVSFNEPRHNGGSIITGYTVTSIPAGGTDLNAGSTALAHTITGLTNGTSYTFTVKAINSVGSSLASTASNSIIPIDNTAPIILAFDLPSTSSSLTVPITTLSASDNNGITGYLLTESSTLPSLFDAGWSITKPDSYSFTSAGTKTLYVWARDGFGNVSLSLSDQVVITLPSISKILGNSEVYSLSSTAAYRRAIPVTFSESGLIQSISIYHNGGTGNVLLGVYSDQIGGTPSSLLGVTTTTVINTTAGWQTVSLINPVSVIAGQTVWLAWVFQNNPGVRYVTGTPGRAQSLSTWSAGMPSTFGTSGISGIKFSIYCSYTTTNTSLKNASIPLTFDFKAVKPLSGNWNNMNSEISTNIEEKNDFILYPNPSKTFINIDYINMPEIGTKIEITDGSGKKLYENQSVSLLNKIDIKQFPIGLYFVRSIHNNQIKIKKLIIN